MILLNLIQQSSLGEVKKMVKELHPKLKGILERKEREVAEMYSSGTAAMYADRVRRNYRKTPVKDFYRAIVTPHSTLTSWPRLIAEFKRTSPSNQSNGYPDYRNAKKGVKHMAKLYQRAGASAISVLGDSGFKGYNRDLVKAKQATNLPILAKDFIIDPAQVYQKYLLGADAILLIGTTLPQEKISELMTLADSLELTCLLESHDEKDVEKVLHSASETYTSNGRLLFGINNRDLYTFEEDITTTLKLMSSFPSHIPLISESSIHIPEDVEFLVDGARAQERELRGILVGTELMESQDPKQDCRHLSRN